MLFTTGNRIAAGTPLGWWLVIGFATLPAWADMAGTPLRPLDMGASLHALAPSVSARAVGTDLGPSSTGPERMVWNRTPLSIVLHVGQERQVTFPAPMRLGLDASISTRVKLQTVDRTSYITALERFPKTRVIAEDPATGTHILLDLTADDSTRPLSPIEIAYGSLGDERHREEHAGAASGQPDAGGEATPRWNAVELTRYAIQQLYSPRRLTGAKPGIREVRLPDAPIEGLVRGARVRAVPIAGWQSEAGFITGVQITNRGRYPVTLSWEALRGHWDTAAFYPRAQIQPQGEAGDTTVVFLVSLVPFAEAR